MPPPRNDWERVVDLLAGLVAGNEHGESHGQTCDRLLAAEKLLKRVAPDRLRAAMAAAKAAAGE